MSPTLEFLLILTPLLGIQSPEFHPAGKREKTGVGEDFY